MIFGARLTAVAGITRACYLACYCGCCSPVSMTTTELHGNGLLRVYVSILLLCHSAWDTKRELLDATYMSAIFRLGKGTHKGDA